MPSTREKFPQAVKAHNLETQFTHKQAEFYGARRQAIIVKVASAD